MTNYTIQLYSVYFSNGKQNIVKDVHESISAQEYHDLVEGDDAHFAYEAYSAIRKRVEKRFGKKVEYVSNWEAAVEEK